MIYSRPTDLEILRDVCLHARRFSSDPHTQNAAALAAANSVVLLAANAVPYHLDATYELLKRPEKYNFIEHAERAVIYKAASVGLATEGATLYCPWFACTDCARAIILAGIREVVGLAAHRAATPARWRENIDTACQMLEEAGVGLRWLAGAVGVTMRFDGRDFRC